MIQIVCFFFFYVHGRLFRSGWLCLWCSLLKNCIFLKLSWKYILICIREICVARYWTRCSLSTESLFTQPFTCLFKLLLVRPAGMKRKMAIWAVATRWHHFPFNQLEVLLRKSGERDTVFSPHKPLVMWSTAEFSNLQNSTVVLVALVCIFFFHCGVFKR